jgi:hypothetical protein
MLTTKFTSQCRFDPVVGGSSTLTQDIKLCPSAQHTLR